MLPTPPLGTRLQVFSFSWGGRAPNARLLHEGGAKPITPVSSMAQLAAACNAGVSTPSGCLSLNHLEASPGCPISSSTCSAGASQPQPSQSNWQSGHGPRDVMLLRRDVEQPAKTLPQTFIVGGNQRSNRIGWKHAQQVSGFGGCTMQQEEPC